MELVPPMVALILKKFEQILYMSEFWKYSILKRICIGQRNIESGAGGT